MSATADTLAHALRLCELLELDLARLAELQPWATELLAQGADARRQVANRLRWVRDRYPSIPVSETSPAPV